MMNKTLRKLMPQIPLWEIKFVMFYFSKETEFLIVVIHTETELVIVVNSHQTSKGHKENISVEN